MHLHGEPLMFSGAPSIMQMDVFERGNESGGGGDEEGEGRPRVLEMPSWFWVPKSTVSVTYYVVP